jgi:hypothetical protein
MHIISNLVDEYNYISMVRFPLSLQDTEFPGTVYLPAILQNQDTPHVSPLLTLRTLSTKWLRRIATI